MFLFWLIPKVPTSYIYMLSRTLGSYVCERKLHFAFFVYLITVNDLVFTLKHKLLMLLLSDYIQTSILNIFIHLYLTK